MVINESMRLHAPVPIGNPHTFIDETVIKNYTFKKGEKFFIHFEGLHTNPDEWIEPFKFIPERFDPKSDYFFTPEHKKRSLSSYSPFFGGKRVCLGLSLAVNLLRIMVPHFIMEFDISLVAKSEDYPDKGIGIANVK